MESAEHTAGGRNPTPDYPFARTTGATQIPSGLQRLSASGASISYAIPNVTTKEFTQTTITSNGAKLGFTDGSEGAAAHRKSDSDYVSEYGSHHGVRNIQHFERATFQLQPARSQELEHIDQQRDGRQRDFRYVEDLAKNDRDILRR